MPAEVSPPALSQDTTPVVLSLGANIGNPQKQIHDAISKLNALAEDVSVSSFYKSAPLEYSDQADFFNLIWYGRIPASYSLAALFHRCQQIERECKSSKNIPKGPRRLDIDIIFYGDTVGTEFVLGKTVIIPHPRYMLRKFVLLPLIEIEKILNHPWLHPILKRSSQQFLHEEPWSLILRDQKIMKLTPPNED